MKASISFIAKVTDLVLMVLLASMVMGSFIISAIESP